MKVNRWAVGFLCVMSTLEVTVLVQQFGWPW